MAQYIAVTPREYPLTMLNQTSSAGTCVLFVNGTCKEDYESVRTWLNASRFNTYEAADVFEAMDELYDFTGDQVHNIIMVECRDDSMARSGMIDEQVFFYSPGTKRADSIGDLTQLASRLNSFFPASTMRTAA